MGEKYLSLKWLAVQVLSVIPGFILGVYTTWRIYLPSNGNHLAWNLIAGLYFVALLGEIAIYVKACLPTPFH